jgi:hypothetical protein
MADKGIFSQTIVLAVAEQSIAPFVFTTPLGHFLKICVTQEVVTENVKQRKNKQQFRIASSMFFIITCQMKVTTQI